MNRFSLVAGISVVVLRIGAKVTLSAELTLLVKLTWSAELTPNRKVGHHPMESTKPSVTTSRNSRGISIMACVAKTMTWELASTKGATAHKSSSVEVSLPQGMGETQENYQINENHKKCWSKDGEIAILI